MARITCKCGWELSDVAQPNDMEGYLLTSRQHDQIAESPDDAISSGKIMDISKEVWECSECGRLAIFMPRSNRAIWFSPESGDYERVCI